MEFTGRAVLAQWKDSNGASVFRGESIETSKLAITSIPVNDTTRHARKRSKSENGQCKGMEIFLSNLSSLSYNNVMKNMSTVNFWFSYLCKLVTKSVQLIILDKTWSLYLIIVLEYAINRS